MDKTESRYANLFVKCFGKPAHPLDEDATPFVRELMNEPGLHLYSEDALKRQVVSTLRATPTGQRFSHLERFLKSVDGLALTDAERDKLPAYRFIHEEYWRLCPAALDSSSLISVVSPEKFNELADKFNWKSEGLEALQAEAQPVRREYTEATLEYLKAVLRVADSPHEYKNQHQWSGAVARKYRPGATATAVLNCFKGCGLIREGEKGKDYQSYRPRIEAEARRLREEGII